MPRSAGGKSQGLLGTFFTMRGRFPAAQVFRLVTVAVLAGLILWAVPVTWRNLGLGILPIVLVSFLAACLVVLRPRNFRTRWHRWLSVIPAALLVWGALSFFYLASGALADASLGGYLGGHVAGQGAFGVLRLIGYGLLTFAFFAPSTFWRAIQNGSRLLAKGASTILKAIGWGVARGGAYLWSKLRPGGAQAARETHGRAAATVHAVDAGLHKLKPGATPELPDAEPESVDANFQTLASPTTPSNGEATAGVAVAMTNPNTPTKPTEPALPPEPDVPLMSPVLPGGWRLPAIEALDHDAPVVRDRVDNQARARGIEEALLSYGIEANVIEVNPGPAVTQFGLEPGWVRKYREVRLRDEEGKQLFDESGNPMVRREEVSRTRIKVDAIANLDKDLAMALAAPSIRIEAPIPGKAMVGIEVPNAHPETVSLRSAIQSPPFQKLRTKSKLAIVLGKGSGGQIEVADLGDMPHLLVAGATGSGKSIGLRSVLICLLMHSTPKELRMLLIDPKRVELVAFNSVPHLIAPAIVDVERVVDALRWAIQEMEERYKKFSTVGSRNLEAYNKNRLVNEPLPCLVIVIDELADLMMAAPYDVEHSITRLAQLGRATGIHMIVSTQRPSVDVVTGLIKANFPTRLSFAVSSLVDSRTILDTGGAEKLLGKGDMLYLPQDAPKPKRIQGVYVSDAEVERVVRAWNSQHPPGWEAEKPPQFRETPPPVPVAPPGPVGTFRSIQETPSSSIGVAPRAPMQGAQQIPDDDEDGDPLVQQARDVAKQHTRVSPSLLQRKLKVGYNKAARLVDLLEEEGYDVKGRDDDVF